jgi:hypothetical protein
MKRSSVIALSVMVCSIALAQPQPPDSLWSRTFGGSGSERAWSVQQTTDGGYVVLGDSNVFAPEGSPCHFYLVKTDEDGNAQWSRDYGGNYFEYAQCVQQTTDGGYILAGRTYSFGAGSSDSWLVKTNAIGDSVWSRTYGGSNYDCANSVQQTFDGGYVVAGYTNSFTVPSIYLVKTDAIGIAQWSRTFAFGEAQSVQQTTDGGYIMAGYTESFGAGHSDFYLIKTNAAGESLWARTFGGTEYDFAFSVQQTSDGGYIVAGHEDYWGNANGYLVKTDANGDSLWTHTFDGGNMDFAFSVRQTSDGGYVMAGWTASFGLGDYDIYLEKIDSNGFAEWTAIWGGGGDDRAYSVQQTTDGGYILAGSTTSFGAGGTDFWLVKTAPELVTFRPLLLRPSSFLLRAYPNPFNAATVICYSLPHPAHVDLEVFDILGRVVNRLDLGNLSAGSYSRSLDFSPQASGTYLVRLRTPDQAVMMKIMLVK